MRADRKATAQTRDRKNLEKDHPSWVAVFADLLPEKDKTVESVTIKETTHAARERVMKESTNDYERFAWLVYENITSKTWFEAFILVNIVLTGVAAGIDLEFDGRSAGVANFVAFVSVMTQIVFTVECALKIVSEGKTPLRYFLDEEDGYFNTFDFAIVACGYVFMSLGESSAVVGALRTLRLIRLLTFIKGVQQLRVIVAGLIQGMKSVVYICMLLFLVVYLFAIIGATNFGENDPQRFGTVSGSMLTLLQVSTLASWTPVAYTAWYGCQGYLGSAYGDENPSVMPTSAGLFEGYKCSPGTNDAQATKAFFFFSFYVVITAWVIMSLFIGVISMVSQRKHAITSLLLGG